MTSHTPLRHTHTLCYWTYSWLVPFILHQSGLRVCRGYFGCRGSYRGNLDYLRPGFHLMRAKHKRQMTLAQIAECNRSSPCDACTLTSSLWTGSRSTGSKWCTETASGAVTPEIWPSKNGSTLLWLKLVFMVAPTIYRPYPAKPTCWCTQHSRSFLLRVSPYQFRSITSFYFICFNGTEFHYSVTDDWNSTGLVEMHTFKIPSWSCLANRFLPSKARFAAEPAGLSIGWLASPTQDPGLIVWLAPAVETLNRVQQSFFYPVRTK